MSNPSDPNFQQPAAPQYSAPAPPAAPAPPVAPAYAAPVAAPTNTLSIISMISSIVGLFTFGLLSVLGVILGHISLGQIKRNGEGGKGMAITGLIVGYIGIVGWVLGLIAFFVLMGLFAAAMNDPSFVSELNSLS